MSLPTPATILAWFKTAIVDALQLHESAVMVSTHDTSPPRIPPTTPFIVISPREMRFVVPEQNPAQCVVEWDVRVRVFSRLAIDRAGSIDAALLSAESGLYALIQKIIHAVLTQAPPDVPLRGCYAASATGPVEWLTPLEGQLSFISIAIDFRTDFDWVFD